MLQNLTTLLEFCVSSLLQNATTLHDLSVERAGRPTQGPSEERGPRPKDRQGTTFWRKVVVFFLPGLAFAPVRVCLPSCRGLASPGSCSPGVCPVCGLVFRFCPLLLLGRVSPCGRRPEDRHCFGGIQLVTFYSPRRVGSIVRMPRQVLGLRIVVRAVTSAHAS